TVALVAVPVIVGERLERTVDADGVALLLAVRRVLFEQGDEERRLTERHALRIDGAHRTATVDHLADLVYRPGGKVHRRRLRGAVERRDVLCARARHV